MRQLADGARSTSTMGSSCGACGPPPRLADRASLGSVPRPGSAWSSVIHPHAFGRIVPAVVQAGSGVFRLVPLDVDGTVAAAERHLKPASHATTVHASRC